MGSSGPFSRKRYMEILFRAVRYIRVIVVFFFAMEVLHDRKVQYGYSLSDSTNEEMKNLNAFHMSLFQGLYDHPLQRYSLERIDEGQTDGHPESLGRQPMGLGPNN